MSEKMSSSRSGNSFRKDRMNSSDGIFGYAKDKVYENYSFAPSTSTNKTVDYRRKGLSNKDYDRLKEEKEEELLSRLELDIFDGKFMKGPKKVHRFAKADLDKTLMTAKAREKHASRQVVKNK